jgi:hypothetical protein
MHLNAILFLPRFLIGPGPLTLFFFPLSFLPCGPTQLVLFPPLPLFPHGPAGPASSFSFLPAQPSPADLFSSLPSAQPAPFSGPARSRASSLPPLALSHADGWDPPVGAVPDLEPDSGSSPSPAATRHGCPTVRRLGPHAKAAAALFKASPRAIDSA